MPFEMNFDLTQINDGIQNYGKFLVVGESAFPLKVRCDFGKPSFGEFYMGRVPICGSIVLIQDGDKIRTQQQIQRSDGNDRQQWTVSESIEKRIHNFAEYFGRTILKNEKILRRIHQAFLKDYSAKLEAETQVLQATIAVNQAKLARNVLELQEVNNAIAAEPKEETPAS